MSIVVDDMQELRAEIDQLTGSKAVLQTEIERLRALNDDRQAENERLAIERNHIERQLHECDADRIRLQAIVDGNERCQAEYLAIIEKKTIECDQTWTKHLIIREELKAEMTALQMALIRATAEIAQLKNGVS
jgi:regulator of replication initiation timing